MRLAHDIAGGSSPYKVTWERAAKQCSITTFSYRRAKVVFDHEAKEGRSPELSQDGIVLYGLVEEVTVH